MLVIKPSLLTRTKDLWKLQVRKLQVRCYSARELLFFSLADFKIQFRDSTTHQKYILGYCLWLTDHTPFNGTIIIPACGIYLFALIVRGADKRIRWARCVGEVSPLARLEAAPPSSFCFFNYPLPHRTLLPIIIYCLQIVLFLRICLTFNFNCLLSSSRTLVSMLFRN